MIRRLLLAVGIALVALLAGSGSASASAPAVDIDIPGIETGCPGPTPDMPDRGAIAMLMGTPEQTPPAADPFAPGANTTIYEQYGLAGMDWHACDVRDGLAGALPDGPSTAGITTTVSNWMFGAAKLLLALWAAIARIAFDPSWMSVFSPLLTAGTAALYEAIVKPWLPVVLTVVTLTLLYQWRKTSLTDVALKILQVGAIIFGIMIVLAMPVAVANAANSVAPHVVAAIGTEMNTRYDGTGSPNIDPTTAAVGATSEALIYRQWANGVFGTNDSPAAEEFGPRLFKASAMSWSEAERYDRLIADGDQDAANDMIDAKRDAYKEAMADLEKRDPVAYDYATGRDDSGRFWAAVAAFLSVLATLPFLIVGSILMIFCYVATIVSVIWFVGQAMFGAINPSLATGPLAVAYGSSLTVVMTGTAVNLDVLATRVVLDRSSGIDWLLGIILSLIIMLVAFAVIRPVYRMWSMFGGHAGRTRKYTKKGAKLGRRKVIDPQYQAFKGEITDTRDALRQDIPAARERRYDRKFGPVAPGATPPPVAAAKATAKKATAPARPPAQKTAAKAPAKKTTAKAPARKTGPRRPPRPPVQDDVIAPRYTVWNSTTQQYEVRTTREGGQP
jgi:hypothetical protein